VVEVRDLLEPQALVVVLPDHRGVLVHREILVPVAEPQVHKVTPVPLELPDLVEVVLEQQVHKVIPAAKATPVLAQQDLKADKVTLE